MENMDESADSLDLLPDARAVEGGLLQRSKVTLHVTVLMHSGFEDQLNLVGKVLSTLQMIVESLDYPGTNSKRSTAADSMVCDFVLKDDPYSVVFRFLDDQSEEKSSCILARSYGIVFFVETLTNNSLEDVLRVLKTFEDKEQLQDYTTLVLAREVAISKPQASRGSMYFMEVDGQYKLNEHPFRKFVCSMNNMRNKLQKMGRSKSKTKKEKDALVTKCTSLVNSVFNL